MSYYWRNREVLLKKHITNITILVVKKGQKSIISKIKKKLRKKKETSTSLCLKTKKI